MANIIRVNFLNYMKVINGIKGKLIFYTSIIVILTYTISIGFVIINSRNKAIKDAEDMMYLALEENANGVKARLNSDLGLARSMASTFVKFRHYPDSIRNIMYGEILEGVLDGNEKYYNAWLSLEMKDFDANWSLPYGRKTYTYYHHGDPVFKDKNIEGDDIGSLYHRLKLSKLEEISEPYYFAEVEGREPQFVTSICVPLLLNGEFAGTTGMDVLMSYYDFAAVAQQTAGATTFLVANNSTFAYHAIDSLIGKDIASIFPEQVLNAHAMTDKIKNGEKFSFKSEAIGELDDVYVTFVPVQIGNSTAPWSVGMIVPKAGITSSIERTFLISILGAVIGFGILMFAIFRVGTNISEPLTKVNRLLQKISEGDISEKHKLKTNTKDEIGGIVNSVNGLIDTLNDKVAFAKAIGEQNLELEFTVASEEDILGKSLIQMRESLQENRDLESKRNWVTNGIAQFSDILRSTHEDQQAYYQNFVSEITKYVNANQCGLFILREDNEEQLLDLVAAYAYERQKYLKKSVAIGEGVVGQCFLEAKNIYMKEIPDNYVAITSGLGDAPPKNLLVVPLLIDGEVQGVMELASFQLFERHEVEFIEKIAESLASTIAALKVNTKTKNLLEESQQRAEEMQASEEEMRQNMEELEATQEEMRRTQQQFEEHDSRLTALLNATDDAIMIMDKEYKLVLINDALKARYVGTKYQMDIGDNVLERLGDIKEQWLPFYEKALNGEKLEFVLKSRLEGEDKHRYYNISPIFNKSGQVVSAALISRDAFMEGNMHVMTEEEFYAAGSQ